MYSERMRLKCARDDEGWGSLNIVIERGVDLSIQNGR